MVNLSCDKGVIGEDPIVTSFVLDVPNILSETTRATVEMLKKDAAHHKEMAMQRIQCYYLESPDPKSQNQ